MLTPQMIDRLWQAFHDTVLMVGVSAGIAVLTGIPLAVFLVTSGPGGIFPAPRLNRIVGAVVNGFRAVPFIVLLVALIPLTRLLAGTTIGVWAAIVPLSISAMRVAPNPSTPHDPMSSLDSEERDFLTQ